MLAIANGTLYTISCGVVKGGIVLVDDEGRIAAVGVDVEIPDDAHLIDAAGLHVFPGFVDAHTHLGIWEEGVGRAFWDGNEATDPITPHVRALDAINPRDPGLADARGVGVTTVCVTPGSANAICGQAVVIKTAGEVVDRMVVRQPAGLKMALGENPKSVYKPRDKMPSTRMGIAALIREALVNTRNYLEKQAQAAAKADEASVKADETSVKADEASVKADEASVKADETSVDPPDEDLKLEAMALALRGEIPTRIHAHRADDILTALRLGQEFDLQIAVEHCTEGHKVAAELAEAGVPALVGPSLTSRSKMELRELSFATAGELHKAGVTVALISDHPFVPIQYLPLCGGLAVREGLDAETALRALTLTPAEILGVDSRVGSLEPGKDADLALYHGHPFYDVQARCIMTLVEGRIVHDERAA